MNTHVLQHFGNNDGAFARNNQPDNMIIFPVMPSAINDFMISKTICLIIKYKHIIF